jgi:hypothetical protein
MEIQDISRTEYGVQIIICLVEGRHEYGPIKNKEWPRFDALTKQLKRLITDIDDLTLVHVDSKESRLNERWQPQTVYQLSLRKVKNI